MLSTLPHLVHLTEKQPCSFMNGNPINEWPFKKHRNRLISPIIFRALYMERKYRLNRD